MADAVIEIDYFIFTILYVICFYYLKTTEINLTANSVLTFINIIFLNNFNKFYKKEAHGRWKVAWQANYAEEVSLIVELLDESRLAIFKQLGVVQPDKAIWPNIN